MPIVLGEFEQLVLLAMLRLGPQAYGATIRREIEKGTGRELSISAVYTTLQRLEQKGLVRSRMGEPRAERGGRRRKHAELLPAGARALKVAYNAFAGMAAGVEHRLAQVVGQRTSEIGIRMALGARRGDVLRLVLGRATLVTVIGLAVGLIAALGLTRVLTTLLYQITPTDPSTLVAVAVVLGTVSLLACYVPARRALKVDAVTALRSE